MSFRIQRTKATVSGQAAAVRADIDVRTGGEQIAQAVAGLGGAVANLGLRWDIMEASTQLNEAKMFARQEHVRLMLELPGLEPSEHAKAYEQSLKIRQDFTPKNRRAAASYGQLLDNFSPQWGLDVDNATKLKLKDDKRAVGYLMQQGAIEDGNFTDYFTHLEEGKKLGVYSAEEVVKYKQFTIDSRNSYVRSGEIRSKAEAKEQRIAYVEKVEQDFLVKLRERKLTEGDVMGSLLDVNEKQEWLGYIEKQRERILSGADIITDQARKHELLDMAAAIKWPDRQVTSQEVNKLAREGRYGAAASLDDAAYDEIRDAIRRSEEDKIPFTQKYIENIIGEIITGAPSSVLGLPLPTLRTREDAVRHATNAFGRFVNRVPGVMDTIDAKYSPEKLKSTPSEPKGNPAHDFDGELIGSYNPDGSITLNWEGTRRLWELSGRDAKKAREMALQNRYIIPLLKEK